MNEFIHTFDGFVPLDSLQSIWHNALKNYPTLSTHEILEIVSEQVKHELTCCDSDFSGKEDNITNKQSEDSSGLNYINDKEYDVYFELFSTLFELKELDSIWKSFVDTDDQLGNAVLCTISLLNQPEPYNFEEFLDSHSTDSQDSTCVQSTQQVAIDFVANIFKGENIKKKYIQMVLRDNKYDIETAINVIIDSKSLDSPKKKKYSVVRNGISFKDVIGSNNSDPLDKNIPIVMKPKSNESIQTIEHVTIGPQCHEKVTIDDNSVHTYLLLWSYRNKTNPTNVIDATNKNQLKFGLYFYNRVQKNNPKHQFNYKQIYKSSQLLFQMYYVGSLAATPNIQIDLHGLTVDYSIQMVRSALEYYQRKQSITSGDCASIKVNSIAFVVGKGLHSKKHVPILGPAVMEYLEDNYSKSSMSYKFCDGVVLIQF